MQCFFFKGMFRVNQFLLIGTEKTQFVKTNKNCVYSIVRMVALHQSKHDTSAVKLHINPVQRYIQS